VNPIRNFKFVQFLDLCPQLTKIRVDYLPITEYVLSNLLSIIILAENKYPKLKTIEIGEYAQHKHNTALMMSDEVECYSRSQCDFWGGYSECVRLYSAVFEEHRWSLHKIFRAQWQWIFLFYNYSQKVKI
jgi:hypothetical protein